ncbi:MAG: adenosylcobinamide-phosphate synthase CbiB [Synechococcaceae cyanobacterium]|nr:adenosylcobinamide-phosphate synthase CbiB [Synechococcaceae cyanobacterium]
MPAACLLDRLIGDPRRLPHPVQVMGLAITLLRRPLEGWAADRPGRLRLAGLTITLLLVALSGSAGWMIERLAWAFPRTGGPLLLVAMASTLAGGSLAGAVRAVVSALPDLPAARARLAWIVGRDVDGLPEAEILRAAAETAAENAVDGLFAPLFWLLAGTLLVSLWPAGPGPLSLAWIFKAASTLDSMLGYRRGRLRWLGTAGARLDDALTWLPCRLVALSLPVASGGLREVPRRFRSALREGRTDPSPNAGVSQAAYAQAAGVRLGGRNRYGGEERSKPILGAGNPPVDREAVERILRLTARLEGLWLLVATPALAFLPGWRWWEWPQ